MGYTHYFAYHPERDSWVSHWGQLLADTEEIIENAHCQVANGLGDFNTEPHVGEDGIRLNGWGEDQAHETFSVSPQVWSKDWFAPGEQRKYKDRGFVWDFCKTARKPYDEVVAAILLRAHLLMPTAFVFSSDGEWDEEWEHGAWYGTGSPRELVRALFGTDGGCNPFERDTLKGAPAIAKDAR